MTYIEIKVKEIAEDPESNECFRMILEDVEEGLELPIVICAQDARPLLAQLNSEQNLRPNTHDLFSQFIAAAGYRIKRMNIHDFRQGVFYAALILDSENKERIEMDCRPTDGVALALRANAPLFVDREVMKKVGILLNNDMGKMKLPQRILVMEEKLQRLVREERYEEAGILRDQINVLRSEQM